MITTINEFKKFYNYNLIPGGLSDNKTIEDIAKKYYVSIDEVITKLKKGIKVELEHTSDERIATEIAMDHLIEMFDYYEKLEIIEEQKDTEIFSNGKKTIEDTIKNLHKISPELKEIALQHIQSYTSAKNGIIHELKPDQNLIDKCKENDLEIGFGMGIDKDGYFIQTHRARSKSYKSSSDITIKDIKFINSTG